LVEKSVAGWKEYELEVMRDVADNCVVICSIENFDPMGVHTGDSITVAPIQTLSDVEYQAMRDDAFAVLRRVGVETGGSNVQFAVNPETGERLVIEMNPRVSRSSALASKATGFPIAKIAAKLAVGYRLDEIENDITRVTPASFEPVIDYVVTKIPRWAFEKLPGRRPSWAHACSRWAKRWLSGATSPSRCKKPFVRSNRAGSASRSADNNEFAELDDETLWRRCEVATPERLFALHEVLWRGAPLDEVVERTRIDAVVH
jgi:carbamoyl-phosphate synthase large subunit